jgi:hypothetical protein
MQGPGGFSRAREAGSGSGCTLSRRSPCLCRASLSGSIGPADDFRHLDREAVQAAKGSGGFLL